MSKRLRSVKELASVRQRGSKAPMPFLPPAPPGGLPAMVHMFCDDEAYPTRHLHSFLENPTAQIEMKPFTFATFVG